jgi:hypothetical protein
MALQDLKMLPLSALLKVISEDFPEVGTLPRHTRYDGKYQRATYQMLGAKLEHELQGIHTNQLAEKGFDIVMLPCAGIEAAERALIVVLLAVEDTYYPKTVSIASSHCR